MEQKRYQALFYGELKDGHSKEMAIRALAGAYQKEDDFFVPWFSSEKTVVKKDATLEEAEYIRDYLGDIGLVIKIEPLTLETKVEEKIGHAEKEAEQLIEETFAKIKESFESVQADAPKQTVIKVIPASMGKRFAAYIIDLIICMIAANFLLELVLAPIGLINTSLIHELSVAVNSATTQNEVRDIVDSYMGNDAFASLIMQVLFFVFAVQIAYFGFLDGKYKGTFGKRLFKLKLYSLVSPKISLKQAALRQVYMVVVFLLLTVVLNLIGLLILSGIFIMGAYDKRGLNQTIFDRLTATVVGNDDSKR